MELVALTLDGMGIRLVPLAVEHLDELCAIGLEPELWRATTIQVRTRTEMAAYVQAALEARHAETALPFVIVERSTGAVVGTTRFHSYAVEDKRIEIGFTWVALARQRTAVNTEAKYLLLRHAFESLGCLRVEFKVDSENTQSRQALLRLGAKLEVVLRRYRVSRHRGVRDLAVFSIIAEEWPAVRISLEKKLKVA